MQRASSSKEGDFCAMAGKFRGFGKDIGIDLGSAGVRLTVRGRGVVLEEPSLLAVDKQSASALATGHAAEELLRRTPGSAVAAQPLREGIIAEPALTEQLLREILRRGAGAQLHKPRLLLSVPAGVSEIEAKAVIDAALQAGAKRAYLIKAPMAAALGAGIDVNLPGGQMLLDIGAGTTDIAVISLGELVEAASLRVAGDQFDEALARFVRRKHGLLIGDGAAELLKREIGCVLPLPGARSVDIKGRDLESGLPKTRAISSGEMAEALAPVAVQILEQIQAVLSRTPPELRADIQKNGITLTGGMSLLRGLERFLAGGTGINTHLAEEPTQCVIRGITCALEDLSALRA